MQPPRSNGEIGRKGGQHLDLRDPRQVDRYGIEAKPTLWREHAGVCGRVRRQVPYSRFDQIRRRASLHRKFLLVSSEGGTGAAETVAGWGGGGGFLESQAHQM